VIDETTSAFLESLTLTLGQNYGKFLNELPPVFREQNELAMKSFIYGLKLSTTVYDRHLFYTKNITVAGKTIIGISPIYGCCFKIIYQCQPLLFEKLHDVCNLIDQFSSYFGRAVVGKGFEVLYWALARQMNYVKISDGIKVPISSVELFDGNCPGVIYKSRTILYLPTDPTYTSIDFILVDNTGKDGMKGQEGKTRIYFIQFTVVSDSRRLIAKLSTIKDRVYNPNSYDKIQPWLELLKNSEYIPEEVEFKMACIYGKVKDETEGMLEEFKDDFIFSCFGTSTDDLEAFFEK